MRVSTLLVALLCGQAALAAAPDDLDDAIQRLKDAQTKNDPAAIKKEAVEIHKLAQRITSAPPPADPEEKEAWTKRVEYVKSIDLQSEHALVSTALQADGNLLIDLISALEECNPKSQYLDDAYGAYVVALTRTGGAPKVTPVAEKALANFPENEDLLLIMLDSATSKNQNERAASYAGRLVSVMGRHPKPAGVSAADWERKRTLSLAHGYWTIGVVNAEKGQYVIADKNLRAALPLIKSSPNMLGPALFHLGVVNYQLGKMTASKARVLEGAGFSEQCANMDSPYADQARRNGLVMRQEAQRMR